MSVERVRELASQWQVPLPDAYVAALTKLPPGSEIGIWSLSDEGIDPSVLAPGGPINLFPIGEDGMGDFLCFFPDTFSDDPSVAVVMWSPEQQTVTRLGADFADFLEKESFRRLDFLLERAEPISESAASSAWKGEAVAFEEIEEDKRIFAEMIADVCQVAGQLGLSEAIADRASGKAETPDFLREVDARDESDIDRALSDLQETAKQGDAAAAFEAMGFLQLRQKPDEVAQWSMHCLRCLLYTWPIFNTERLTKIVDLVKTNAAAIPAVERLDPLYKYVTSQVPTKVDGRMSLAKQYMRSKDAAGAAREAQQALRLCQSIAASPEDAKPAMQAAYALLVEIFKSAGRSRELAYTELMLGKLG